MTADLTDADREAIKAAIVRGLIIEIRDEVKMFTLAEVCGLLNLDAQTIKTLPIPKTTFKPGLYRYPAAGVVAFIAARTA